MTSLQDAVAGNGPTVSSPNRTNSFNAPRFLTSRTPHKAEFGEGCRSAGAVAGHFLRSATRWRIHGLCRPFSVCEAFCPRGQRAHYSACCANQLFELNFLRINSRCKWARSRDTNWARVVRPRGAGFCHVWATWATNVAKNWFGKSPVTD
jgi:hypothetical protein